MLSVLRKTIWLIREKRYGAAGLLIDAGMPIVLRTETFHSRLPLIGIEELIHAT